MKKNNFSEMLLEVTSLAMAEATSMRNVHMGEMKLKLDLILWRQLEFVKETEFINGWEGHFKSIVQGGQL